ncbi:MAG TPA: von Willebrand factor type A domain-containing protein [Opitutus sp.]|nr:von Willebrand factor type A domain-containing protein [Opitutus sp.]
MKQALTDDPKLTAYALGELEGDERAAVEAALRGDPAARAAVEEIRAMAARLELALGTETVAMDEALSGGALLPETRRAAIVAGGDLRKLDGGPLPRDVYGRPAKGKLLRFPQIYFLVGGLAAAGFAIFVAVREQDRAAWEAKQRVYREVSLVERAPVEKEREAQLAQPATDQTSAGGKNAPEKAASEFSVPIELHALAEQALKERTDWKASVTLGAPPPAQTFGYSGKVAAKATQGPVALDAPAATQSGKAAAYVYPRDDKFVVEAKPQPETGVAAAAPAGETIVLSPFEVTAAPGTGYAPPSTLAGTRLRTDLKDMAGGVSVVTPQFLGDVGSGSRQQALHYFGQGAVVGGAAGKEFNTEAYAYRAENGFLSAEENPLSTFSADVDTASYANVRRFLENGQRPPADAVRIEELVNYFPYRYAGPGKNGGQGPSSAAKMRGEGTPPPNETAPFAASLEVADAPWAAGHRLVRIGLKGREVAASERGAANLVFLLDVSGSMNMPNKLPLVKESMRMLLGRLRPDDRVAIVVYAGASGLALPSTLVAQAREITDAIDELSADGSTNGAMGIQLAYDIAKANFVSGGINRVILCTDGDFNVGVTSEGELVRLIQEKAKSGVFLTVLGFGMGNYKDATLQQLADAGNGNYGYVDTRREAEKLLVEQVNGTLVTIAKDVKLQVEFNPAQVASYRLIGYEKRLLQKEDFNNDKIDAGEIGAGHTVTALYEIVPVGAPPAGNRGQETGDRPAVDPLKYQRRVVASASVMGPVVKGSPESGELLTLKVRYKQPDGLVSRKLEFPLTDGGERFADASADFQFAAAVAEFGMILRDSPNKGTGSLADVQRWAEAGASNDPGGYRAEFVGLVRKAAQVMP